MTERRLAGGDGLSTDQAAVLDAHFGSSGVVCTPAGSGTGKTTTAVEVVAEAVVRELDENPDQNPFEAVLVTTFTRDAARQLKTELKRRLRAHREAAPDDDPVVRRWGDVVRWLETASNVQTIDSLTQELLREIAIDAGVAPSFGVADGIRHSDLLEEVFADLRADASLDDERERLARAFPGDGPNDPGWEAMVANVHRNCRQCCLSITEARRALLRSVTAMHAGREPEDFDDVVAILDALTDYDTQFVREMVDDEAAWADHAAQTYRTSRRLAGDFGVLLAAFEERYDDLSRSRGSLTHTDITHVVREYLAGEGHRADSFEASLAGGFDHVVVDEFQDTSYAQCRVLAHLVSEADALLIGDPKQSIYEWRSAEPRLFSELIAYARGDTEDNVLDADRVTVAPLAENFRSHPHLVRAANHVFPRLFADPGRGGIGTFDVEYDHLSAERVDTDDEAHVHALQIDEADPDDDQTRREASVEAEAERVAGTLRTAIDEGTLCVDRAQATGDDEPDRDGVRAGDVAVLFRTRRYMRVYSRVLDRYGIDNAVLGTNDLFEEPEIAALIGVLAWVGRPGDPGAVRRFADSPVSGLSDRGRRELADHGYDVEEALSEWDGPTEERRELRAWADLRADLARRRDGSKARLVSELLARSAFDAAALADGDGVQRYANLRRFVDVVEEWEEDRRLSYPEFLRRLDRLREGLVEDDTQLASIAEADSPSTVKLMTAHTAKGLEFPVVVLADTTHDESHLSPCDEGFVVDRRHGVALRPSTGGSVQPNRELFPTFDGGWFHDDDSGFDDDRGLLWLSEVRGDDGRIRHDHPFRAYVQDRRAEFWRLLYVAVTRAGDHLLLPFPTRRGGNWTTWAGALAEYVDPDSGGIDAEGGTVPVSVDEIPVADPPDGVDVDVGRLLEDPGSATDWTTDRRFRPRSLAATQVEGLLSDPAAFQRKVFQGVGAADPVPREDAGGSLSWTGDHDPPGDVAPDEYGETVHRVLAAVNADPELIDDESRLATVVDRALDATLGDGHDRGLTAGRIRSSVLPAYRETATWRALQGAELVLPEFDLAAPLPETVIGGRTGLLRGRVDLLYREDGYHLVDFKTGAVPDPDGDRAAAYRRQLDAYAWLLSSVHGIDLATARLLYVSAGTEREVDPDPARFGAELAGLGDLFVDRDGLLRRDGASAEQPNPDEKRHGGQEGGG